MVPTTTTCFITYEPHCLPIMNEKQKIIVYLYYYYKLQIITCTKKYITKYLPRTI